MNTAPSTPNRVVRNNTSPVVGQRVYELARPVSYRKENGHGGLCAVGQTRHVVACDPSDMMAEAYGFNFTIMFPCTATGEILGAELAESHESFDDTELLASMGIAYGRAVREPLMAAMNRRSARLDGNIAAHFDSLPA